MATAAPPSEDQDVALEAENRNADTLRKLRFGALGAAVLAVIGALGPWAHALGGLFTVHGTDSGGDGVIVIILAVLYAAAIGRHFYAPKRWLAIAATVFAALILVIAAVDYSSLGDNVDEEFRDAISSGWGLWLTGIAGLAAAVCSIAIARLSGRKLDPN
jgi:hypothetical protein